MQPTPRFPVLYRQAGYECVLAVDDDGTPGSGNNRAWPFFGSPRHRLLQEYLDMPREPIRTKEVTRQKRGRKL